MDNKNNYFTKVKFLISSQLRKKSFFLLFLMGLSLIVELFGLGIIIPIITIFTDYESIKQYEILYSLVLYFNEPSQAQLMFYSIMFLLLFFMFKAIIVSFVLFKQMKFIFQSQRELSVRLFNNYLRLTYENFVELNSSLLTKNIIKESQLFALNCVQPILHIISEGIIFIGIIIFLLIIEPVGAIISFTSLIIPGLIFYRYSKNKVIKWGHSRMAYDEKRFQFIQEGFGAFKMIKIFKKESYFIENYNNQNLGSANQDLKVRFIDQLPRLFLELFAVIGLSSLLIALMIQDIEIEKFIPTLGLFAFAVFRIMPSVSRILSQITSLRFSDSVVDELFDVLKSETTNNKESTSGKKLIPFFKKEINLKNVSFKYANSSNFILKDIDLEIKKGSKIAIVGSSGSGKSTLLDLILGVLKPVSGQVFYDNHNIISHNLDYQKLVGYIPQSIFLIDDTMKNNIGFGLNTNDINNEMAQSAIKKSALDDFVKSLPKGLETIVGERGVKLSGGQIQRIGIARALYNNPEILILDEATSALDMATEKKIMDSIISLNKDKTIIIVTHRFESVKNCDEVYEISNNKLTKTSINN